MKMKKRIGKVAAITAAVDYAKDEIYILISRGKEAG